MTRPAERWLTPVDRSLLEAVVRERSVVRAARSVRIGRDRAVYRLQRLERLYGGPAARGRRGGTTPGETVLTALGRRLLAAAGGVGPSANRWRGTYVAGPPRRVRLDGGGEVAVAFRARDGEAVEVAIDPEAVVVGRSRVTLSARNALRATVAGVRPRADGTATVLLRWAGRPVRAALTGASVARLGLKAGRSAYLYVKATAVRRSA